MLWLPLLMACGGSGDGDSGETGPPPVSDSGTTSNAAPSAPGVRIIPSDPSEDDDLACEIEVEAVDPDGDAVAYHFAWLLDDADTAHDSESLPASATSAEQTWACEVVADDGQQTGYTGRAQVTIAAANRPPEAPVVQVDPAAPADNQDLNCTVSVDASDPDGDPLTTSWAWTRDGSPVSETSATVSRSETTLGEIWGCAATVSDGELTATSAPSTAAIGPAVYTGDVSHMALSADCSSCYACPDETWYQCELAFDNDVVNTTWHTTWTGGPEWVGVDFGDGHPRTITRYGLMGAQFSEGYRAVDWTLEGSSDGVGWDVLHAVTGANLAYVMYGGEPFTYYTFDNLQSYQHYRVHVTENAGGQPYADELGIVEIELMEDAP